MSAIRDVLVIVDAGGKRPSLSLASDLALAFDAHLTGLALVREMIGPAFAMAPIPSELIVAARESALEEAGIARAAFEEAARRSGRPFATFTVNMLLDGFPDILRYCRLTDIVAITQDDPDRPEPGRLALLETIVFESGVPAIVVPHSWQRGLVCERVLVAWDGSATAARAVHAALPLLAKASEITVLIVDANARMAEESGFDIGDYLARHGLKVEIARAKRGEVSVVDKLLNFVADKGIDLVVMGAYGHSRLREMVFGGATNDILSELTVPVLLAH